MKKFAVLVALALGLAACSTDGNFQLGDSATHVRAGAHGRVGSSGVDVGAGAGVSVAGHGVHVGGDAGVR